MKVYGHRGAAGEAPENTIAACRHAIERGARYLELDLRLSADKQLVVIHDTKVNRTSYDRGLVSSFTVRELASMDARRIGPLWPRKRETRISTLDKVLDATPEAKGYYLEVKADSLQHMGFIAELLADRFDSRAESKKIVVTSSDRQLHNRLRTLAPHIPLGLVSMRPNVIQQLDLFDYQHLLLHWGVCFPQTIRSVHKRGITLAAWSVNEPQTIRTLYSMKVDNLITDYPSMALPLVASLMR